MVGTYADLALLADTVNAAAQRMLESGELSLDQLDRSPTSARRFCRLS